MEVCGWGWGELVLGGVGVEVGSAAEEGEVALEGVVGDEED